jgi:hypothetical protein
MLGGHWQENLWYLITASPPAKLAKRTFVRSDGALSQPVVNVISPPSSTLLSPHKHQRANIPTAKPILIVGANLEGESGPEDPRRHADNNLKDARGRPCLHNSLTKFGVRPIYFVGYGLATDAERYLPLRELALSGQCEVGAHLQPGACPPLFGEISELNQKLPAWLQKEKLVRLTEALETNIGIRPATYRAAQYGIGEEIAWILRSLGYRIDMTGMPGRDLRPQGGADFRKIFDYPYWFGPGGDLLEIPVTLANGGVWSSVLSRWRPLSLGSLEGFSLPSESRSTWKTKRWVRRLLASGHRVFTLSYPAGSLPLGIDQSRFMARLEAFLEIFFGQYGGVAMTPSDLHALIRKTDEPDVGLLSRW